jgi:hypothetical protein
LNGNGDAIAVDRNVLVLDELERDHVDAQVRVQDATERIQDHFSGHKKFSLPCALNW